jgi:hypothetical protein
VSEADLLALLVQHRVLDALGAPFTPPPLPDADPLRGSRELQERIQAAVIAAAVAPARQDEAPITEESEPETDAWPETGQGGPDPTRDARPGLLATLCDKLGIEPEEKE